LITIQTDARITALKGTQLKSELTIFGGCDPRVVANAPTQAEVSERLRR